MKFGDICAQLQLIGIQFELYHKLKIVNKTIIKKILRTSKAVWYPLYENDRILSNTLNVICPWVR